MRSNGSGWIATQVKALRQSLVEHGSARDVEREQRKFADSEQIPGRELNCAYSSNSVKLSNETIPSEARKGTCDGHPLCRGVEPQAGKKRGAVERLKI